MFYLSFEERSNPEIIIMGLQLSDLHLCRSQIGLCKMYRMCTQGPHGLHISNCQRIKICHTKLLAVRVRACRFFISPSVTGLDSIFMTMGTEAKH